MREHILFTDDICSLIKKSHMLKKSYHIVRSINSIHNTFSDDFILSANRNIHTRIFTIDDLLVYWNVLRIIDEV